MADFKAVYEKHKTNAEIAASASEYFFIESDDVANKDRYGSFSYLEIVNDSNIDIKIRLDGLGDRERKLFAKSSIVIDPKDSIFFNTVQLINTSSTTAITAADLNIIARIMQKITTPVQEVKT